MTGDAMIFDYSLAGIVTLGLLVSLSSSEGRQVMTLIGWTQILLFCLIIVALTPPLGGYMTRLFGGERTFLSPILRPDAQTENAATCLISQCR